MNTTCGRQVVTGLLTTLLLRVLTNVDEVVRLGLPSPKGTLSVERLDPVKRFKAVIQELN